MKKVVITGSSKGIGFGLATNFLKRGHQVVIVGSTKESTNKAYLKLNQQYKGKVFEVACDVRDLDQVQPVN